MKLFNASYGIPFMYTVDFILRIPIQWSSHIMDFPAQVISPNAVGSRSRGFPSTIDLQFPIVRMLPSLYRMSHYQQIRRELICRASLSPQKTCTNAHSQYVDASMPHTHKHVGVSRFRSSRRDGCKFPGV
jgi:hypothetical protein